MLMIIIVKMTGEIQSRDVAKAIERVKNVPCTSEDFVRDRFRMDVNAEYNEEQMAAQMFQVSPTEFEKQKEAVRKQYEGTDQWMKAPNGKPTNLTEDQWVTVRTPAFKNWFGDWETKAKYSVDTDIKVSDEKSLRKAGERFVNKTLKNEFLNLEGIVSNTNLQKMASRKALNKSVSEEIHYIAAANVDKLFQWAEVDITHPDRNNDTNIGKIHRIYSPMFVNGVPYVAKLTVKEIITAKRNVIYTVEALEIDKPTMESYDAYAKLNLDPTSYPIVGSINSLNEKLKNVNASKVVDENGEPLVLYHGTDAQFDTFDKTKGRANMDIQGMFFSPWELDAQGYGPNVIPVFLNMRNPATESQGYKALRKYKGQNGAGIKARENLEKSGFDGVNNENEEYIAFEPNQIKDATGRNVEFDPNQNNIYKQQGKTAKGSISLNQQGQRIINLFESADQSGNTIR